MSGGEPIESLSARVGKALASRALTLATAESCTGGWVASAVTAVAGSSAWFDRGFVTYSNAAKHEMLGVSPDTLAANGSVSEATIREMAFGALALSEADVSAAISGIAGPHGGTSEKPVGTVWLAWAARDGEYRSRCARFEGDRENVRRESVQAALAGIIELIEALDRD